ncbi:hypothetical protein KYC_17282 [Achromobacter arsenitoxydans SY8]|uniref:Uncharacterized protein n=2 Tax=Achromobacter TaxID=222 RepID=H0F9K4_9BURK|nr:hypothetical protein KYC_17282 [Achromobacter arsenitoxydans SY8]
MADRRKQTQRKFIAGLALAVVAAAIATMAGNNKADKAPTGPTPALSENAAMADCQAATRQSAKFPSSVSFGTFGGAAQTRNDATVVVRLDFEAKNGFGNLLPQRAICVYPPSAARSVSIEDR